MKRLAYLSILPIVGVIFMAFSVEKVVKYRVTENPDERYFKIYKKPDAQVNNEVLVKENKVVSNLIYGENRIALTMNPTKFSMDAIDVASKYFKKIGFNLEVISFAYHNSSKQLDKFEISITEDIENKKKYRSKKTDVKSDLPSKFTFDLKKMRSKGLDAIITILADRSTGEHFVASLAPPPPPSPNKVKIRIINATGLILDSETLLPVNEVGLYNSDNKLLGKTDANGFFNIGFNVEKEGEIYFKLSTRKEGYSNFVQNEHWGDLEGNLNATYYFGLKNKTNGSESFSKLVIDKKYTSYDEVKDGFIAMKEEFNFDKKVENAKENNDQFFFKIDNDFYLINDSGWIKLNSENDKIIVNNDKIFSAKEINLYVKRSCVTGMSPITSKNASFEIQDKCLPSKHPVKVGMKKETAKDKVGELMIGNKLYFYSIHKKDTTLYNRFGVKVDRNGNQITLTTSPPPAPLKGKTKLSVNNFKEKGLEDLFFQSERMKIPANMVAIKNGIYVEMGVAKNDDYKAFLDYIGQDKYFSKKYAKNMIPENWGNANKMQNPVIYMSFEQGLEYCKWKTEMFTYQMMSQKNADYATILKKNDKHSKKYKFRLPTENEWYLIVKKGLVIKTGFTCVLDLT